MGDSMISNQSLTLKSKITTTMGTWDTFTIFETWVVATKSSVLLKNKLQLERFVLDIATDWTCTIVYRWLDNSQTRTEVSWNKKEWGTWSVWFITMFAFDLLDTDNEWGVQTIKGKVNFQWDNTHSWDEVHNWDESFTKSIKFPVYADATARDAGIPTPTNWMIIYNTAVWLYQKYSAWTWVNDTSGASVPNASEIVAGKVELATDDEAAAGTDIWSTWAWLVVKPSQVKEWLDTVNSLKDQEYYTGEDLDAGDYVFVEGETNYTKDLYSNIPTWLSFSSVTTSSRAWIKITPNKDIIITWIKTYDNTHAKCYLYTLAWVLLTSWDMKVNSQFWSFDEEIKLTTWTSYYLEVDRNWASYTQYRDASPSFPYVWEALNIIYWTYNESGTNEYLNITEVYSKDYTPNNGVWDVTANTRVSRPIFWSWNASATLKLALSKTGSPSVDLWVRIETDNAWGPSGILADPNATAIVSSDSLSFGINDCILSTVTTVEPIIWSPAANDTVGYERWITVKPNKDIHISKIKTHSNCTAQRALIKSVWDTAILASGVIAANEADVNYTLLAWHIYFIWADNNWSNYTSPRTNSGSVVNKTDFDVRWMYDVSSNYYNISWLDYEKFDAGIAMWSDVDKATWVTYDTSNSITYKTWYKVSFDKKTKINTITKDSSCTATTCYLMDEDKNILSTKTFSTNTATFNYNITDTSVDYYVMVDSGWSAYTSESKNTVSFPIDSEVVDYKWWCWTVNIWSFVDEWHWVTAYNNTYTNDKYWVKFKALNDMYIHSFKTQVWVQANTWYLYNQVWTLLETVTLSSWIWTFATNHKFNAWEYFYIQTEQTGGWATEWRYYAGAPISKTNVQFVNWVKNLWSTGGNMYNVIEINDAPVSIADNTNWYNISSMNVVDSFALTEWTKYHLVAYQGTYWSETVNSSNYYSVGYGTNDTTTRNAKLYNWSVWWWLPNITDATWVTYTSQQLATWTSGMRIKAEKDIIIKSITKDSQCASTFMYIKNTSWDILVTESITSDIITLTTPYTLLTGEEIRIEFWIAAWANHYRARESWVSVPIIWTNISYEEASYNWVDSSWYVYNITDIISSEITKRRIYTQSDLFLPNLLSKTDAKYSYKVDRLWTAKETALIWTKPTLIIDGIDPNQTGMTYWDTMYLSNSSWKISSTPWTNSSIVGRAISAEKLFLKNTFNR